MNGGKALAFGLMTRNHPAAKRRLRFWLFQLVIAPRHNPQINATSTTFSVEQFASAAYPSDNQ
jgi:hypothetical protein